MGLYNYGNSSLTWYRHSGSSADLSFGNQWILMSCVMETAWLFSSGKVRHYDITMNIYNGHNLDRKGCNRVNISKDINLELLWYIGCSCLMHVRTLEPETGIWNRDKYFVGYNYLFLSAIAVTGTNVLLYIIGNVKWPAKLTILFFIAKLRLNVFFQAISTVKIRIT